jgi:hypothetical protein
MSLYFCSYSTLVLSLVAALFLSLTMAESMRSIMARLRLSADSR